MEKSKALGYRPTWVFGGTRPVAEAVRKLGFFDVIYDGLEVIDSAIQWAGSVYGRNYAEEGRGESQINFGEILSAAERIEKAG